MEVAIIQWQNGVKTPRRRIDCTSRKTTPKTYGQNPLKIQKRGRYGRKGFNGTGGRRRTKKETKVINYRRTRTMR